MNQSPNLNRSWEESQQIIKNLESELASLKDQLTQKSCQCHIIDPSKIRILLWINRSKTGKPETATLKIGEQRLLGLPRSDRRGESYYRFDEIIEKAEPKTSFKCDGCQAEVVVIGSDNYQEELRQRAAFKKELAEVKEEKTLPCWECKASMKIMGELDEQKPLVCEDCEKKKASKAETPSSEPKSKRQEFKEQIAQAVQENQAKENHASVN